MRNSISLLRNPPIEPAGMASRDDRDAVVAHQLGRRAFMGVDLWVDPGVDPGVDLGVDPGVDPGALFPRQETELLGLAALRALRALAWDGRGLVVMDMGCGSGYLGCAIAHALPFLRVLAVDASAECMALLRRNVERLGLGDRVEQRCGDLFAPLAEQVPAGGPGRFQAILCNQPHPSSCQRILREASPCLLPGGSLLIEIAAGQEEQVTRLFEQAGVYERIESVRDAADEVRVVLGRRMTPLAGRS